MLNFIRKFIDGIKKWLISDRGGFLCDSCKYDHPSACRNPERPNAKVCGEYKKR